MRTTLLTAALATLIVLPVASLAADTQQPACQANPCDSTCTAVRSGSPCQAASCDSARVSLRPSPRPFAFVKDSSRTAGRAVPNLGAPIVCGTARHYSWGKVLLLECLRGTASYAYGEQHGYRRDLDRYVDGCQKYPWRDQCRAGRADAWRNSRAADCRCSK